MLEVHTALPKSSLAEVGLHIGCITQEVYVSVRSRNGHRPITTRTYPNLLHAQDDGTLPTINVGDEPFNGISAEICFKDSIEQEVCVSWYDVTGYFTLGSSPETFLVLHQ
jgi:hypothetical protein